MLREIYWVIKFTTVRLSLAIVAEYAPKLNQMNVVTAFFKGDMKKDIYVEKPGGSVHSSFFKPLSKFSELLYWASHKLKNVYPFCVADLFFCLDLER